MMMMIAHNNVMNNAAMYDRNNSQEEPKPIDDLLNFYLKKEGIDRRYSKLILQELHDATEMTNDQLEEAANEIIKTNSNNSIEANNEAVAAQDESKANLNSSFIQHV